MANDTSYQVFQHYGTNAERLAFTPSPAAGIQPLYQWYETDTNKVYDYTTGWHLISSGAGNVTTAATLTAHALILGNGGVDVGRLGSLGTTTTVLHGNAAGDPSFGAVSLTADVSGTLPVANGGTGLTDAAQIHVVTVSLTDANIKALPTTQIQLVAPPGANKRIKVISASGELDNTAGVYNNVTTTYATCQIQWDTGTSTTWAAAIANDNTTTPNMTTVTTLFHAGAGILPFDWAVPYTAVGTSASGWWSPQSVVNAGRGAFVNKGLYLAFDNNGGGNLTGGNAANSMTIIVYYAIEAV